jgi:hypothetical protein
MLARTAKSCGPDAPTLASSSWEASFLGMMVANKPGHQGELEGNRNTIAQGRPGETVRTCGRLPCAFYLLHTGLRVRQAPGFPCAFSLKVRRMNLHNSGAPCRENVAVCPRRILRDGRYAASSG